MAGPSDEPRVALDRLSALLVEDILSASDEDILAEIREQHGDPDRLAAEMRVLFEKTVTSMNMQHLPTTEGHIASESMLNVARIIPFPKSPPECQFGMPADRRRSDGPRALRAKRLPRRKLTTLTHSVHAVARRFQAYGFALLILCLAVVASTSVYEVKKISITAPASSPLVESTSGLPAVPRISDRTEIPDSPSDLDPVSKPAVHATTASRSAPPSPTFTAAASDEKEVAGLLARGRAYLSGGDVALARVFLRRAAERDDPQAALALGRTYDPAELRRLNIPNFQAQADPAKAREWYRKAAELAQRSAKAEFARRSTNVAVGLGLIGSTPEMQVGAAAAPGVARAPEPRLPVVAFVAASEHTSLYAADAFRKGLRETGYVEDRNVTVEYNWLEGQFERLPALMAEIVRRRVAVITVLNNTLIATTAKSVTATIPIVFSVGTDPVKNGLVASFARPGGNATGINYFALEVSAKRLELLHALAPKATRVAILVNPANGSSANVTLRSVEDAARSIGLRTRVLTASTSQEIDAAFASLAEERADDVLFVSADGFFQGRGEQLVALAARYKIPAAYPDRAAVQAGGLMAYGTDVVDVYRQAGVYTGNILKGAKPADLPVQQSTKFEFVLNRKTAKALGLEIPVVLRVSADLID